MDQLLKQIAFLQDAVLQDALLAAGLIATMILVVGARREFQREMRKREEAFEALAAKVAALPVEAKPQPGLGSVANAGAAPMDSASILARPGVNLNWRVQALRLMRRGQDVAHVSTALGVPRREIELLIRVHDLASGRTPGRFT